MGGYERALYEKQRPWGGARWTLRLVAEEAVKRRLAPRIGRKTVRLLLLAMISSRGGKTVWNVPELDEDYITKTEDVSGDV
jgi:hypothetical protein